MGSFHAAAVTASKYSAEFRSVGVDVAKLGADLQNEGTKSFDDSWQDLLNAIQAKSQALK